jgi:hypothetical protein
VVREAVTALLKTLCYPHTIDELRQWHGRNVLVKEQFVEKSFELDGQCLAYRP